MLHSFGGLTIADIPDSRSRRSGHQPSERATNGPQLRHQASIRQEESPGGGASVVLVGGISALLHEISLHLVLILQMNVK